MVVPSNTTSLATVRQPSLSRRAVLLAALAILAAAAIALATVSLHGSGATSAPPIGAGSTLISYRGLGVKPGTTARAATPSPAEISLARAEHSYGLVP